MQSQHQAWLDLLNLRDEYYLLAFILVVMAYGWYRFLKTSLKWTFRAAAIGALLVVGLACGWGVWHLFPGLGG